MTRSLALVLALSLAGIASCHQPAPLTETQRAEVIKGVKQMTEDFCTDMKKKGGGATLTYLDDSPSFFFVMAPNATPLSYDSLASSIRAESRIFRSAEGRYESLRVEPLSADLAAYTGMLRGAFTDTTGKVIAWAQVETGVVIRRSDGWKFLCAQATMVPEQVH